MRPTATCIINNFNYSGYVLEALESALSQTVPFDEIIVVDDASTDGSQEILTTAYGANPKVRMLLKMRNEGQLAAFNDGFAASSAEILFFLDADDAYCPNYLQQALAFYQSYPDCDFLFCGHMKMGAATGAELLYPTSRCLGYSAVAAIFGWHWVGSITSSLSMRRHILEKFLPVPYTGEWRTRADDCLVWGSSAAGAKKYFLAEPLVNYRIHGGNSYFGRKFSREYKYRRRVAISRLFGYLRQREGHDAMIEHLALREFLLNPHPRYKELKVYRRIINAQRRPWLAKAGDIITLWYHYIRTRAAGTAA